MYMKVDAQVLYSVVRYMEIHHTKSEEMNHIMYMRDLAEKEFNKEFKEAMREELKAIQAR